MFLSFRRKLEDIIIINYFWNPQKEQFLKCFHKNQNPFDWFPIKVWKENPFGHLPRTISPITKFFTDRGAIVSAQLTSEYYKQSPTVQRGMEIPYKGTVKISGTYINLSSMERNTNNLRNSYT